MPDTALTRSALVTALADNTSGLITAQTIRDFLASTVISGSSWDTNETYYPGDMVVRTGNYYIAISQSQGNDPLADPSVWTILGVGNGTIVGDVTIVGDSSGLTINDGDLYFGDSSGTIHFPHGTVSDTSYGGVQLSDSNGNTFIVDSLYYGVAGILKGSGVVLAVVDTDTGMGIDIGYSGGGYIIDCDGVLTLGGGSGVETTGGTILDDGDGSMRIGQNLQLSSFGMYFYDNSHQTTAFLGYAASNLTGPLPAISGANLTSLNGSNISSGTINNARLPTAISVTTLQGAYISPILSKATSYTLTASDSVVYVTASGQTMTLPSAATTTGREYTIKLVASGSCTVATTSSQNIDASTTYSLSAQWKYVTVVSNGTQWYVVANN